MQTTTTREHVQQLNRERFEQNRRHELATDIAERVGYPISHTVEYHMVDGMAYALTDMKHRPFRDQTAQAVREGRAIYSGVNEFENVRLELEHEEALAADAFGRGELGGNIYIKVSKVPDAVVDGTANIRGYRRDLLRSFVRIYYMSDGLMKCHLFSLDGNSPEGMDAVGKLIDINMQPGRGSEEILADHTLDTMPRVADESVEEFAQKIKACYDEAVYKATGEHRSAGSQFLNQDNALHAVKSKPWLLDEHDQAVAGIMSRMLGEDMTEHLIEQSLKRTAAAVKVVEDGGTVGSLADASVDAALQNGNFDRDCPTGETNSNGTLSEMGMNRAKPREPFKPGKCRVCLQFGMVGECKVCRGCENADNRGEDLSAIHAAALRRAMALQAATNDSILRAGNQESQNNFGKGRSKLEMIHRKYGKHVRVTTLKAVGDEHTVISDSQGNEIDRL